MTDFIQKPQKPLHLFKAMELKNPKVSGEYLFSSKLDGWFACADYNPTTGLWSPLKSFSQRIVPAWKHIDINELNIHSSRRLRLIFEAVIPNMDFYTMNGLFNRKKELALDTELWLHDAVPIDSMQTAAERWDTVQLLHASGKFKTVPIYGVSSDQEQWEEWFQIAISNGEEGIVGKHLDSYYCPGGRNESLIKIKAEVTKDLLCTGVIPTVGKKGEPSLNLLLRNKSGAIITVVVPKDADQIAWRNNPSLVIGKVCEVVAMSENVGGSLREPRFKSIRQDKTASDID